MIPYLYRYINISLEEKTNKEKNAQYKKMDIQYDMESKQKKCSKRK